jgi:DNA-binding beta-propeller fold protein YncE
VAFSPDGSFAYVAGNGWVSVIDTATHTEIDLNPATTFVDGIRVPGSFGVAFSPDGSLAYVVGAQGTVSVIDTATHTIIDTNPATPAIDGISVGANSRGVAVSPDGSLVYVTNLDDGTVSVISLVPTTPTSVQA